MLTRELLREEQILRGAAMETARRYGIEAPVTDLSPALKRMGGTVQVLEPGEDIRLHGTVLKEETGGFRIAVPAGHPDRRTVMTARPLGDLVLHAGFLTENWKNLEAGTWMRFLFSRQPVQSALFAEELLMPAELFLETAEKAARGGKVSPAEIAGFFRVSVSLAAVRGRSLGCWL